MRRMGVFLLLCSMLSVSAQTDSAKKHSVTLNWRAPAERAEVVASYNVYRSENEKGGYKLIAKNIKTLTYTDNGVRSGHTYYYKVTSVDPSGRESTPSIIKASVP